jgi:dihydroorotase
LPQVTSVSPCGWQQTSWLELTLLRIEIKNGNLIDPTAGTQTLSRYIADGDCCAWLGADGFRHPTIDATGLAVSRFGGLKVKLREPGFDYKATLESEMCPVAGGVTSLAVADTDPPLDEPGLVEMPVPCAQPESGAGLSARRVDEVKKGERLTEMAELRDAGCVGLDRRYADYG